MFFDKFTDCARKVMGLARQEAQRFNHEYIGTEHILLGLIQEGSGVAANVLKNLNVKLEDVREEVLELFNEEGILEEVRKLEKEKDEAIRNQDFEKAAIARSKADHLRRARRAMRKTQESVVARDWREQFVVIADLDELSLACYHAWVSAVNAVTQIYEAACLLQRTDHKARLAAAKIAAARKTADAAEAFLVHTRGILCRAINEAATNSSDSALQSVRKAHAAYDAARSVAAKAHSDVADGHLGVSSDDVTIARNSYNAARNMAVAKLREFMDAVDLELRHKPQET